MSTPNANQAESYLKDVPEAHLAFWFNHGVIAHNMCELSAALEDMNVPEFEHHVRDGNNDIAAWVEAVIGDGALATKLRLLSTLDATRRMVARRIEEIAALLPPVMTVEAASAVHDVALAKAVAEPADAAPQTEPELVMAAPAPAPRNARGTAKKTVSRKAVAAKRTAGKPVASRRASSPSEKKTSFLGRLLKR